MVPDTDRYRGGANVLSRRVGTFRLLESFGESTTRSEGCPCTVEGRELRLAPRPPVGIGASVSGKKNGVIVRNLVVFLAVLLIGQTAWHGWPQVRDWVAPPVEHPAQIGREVAERLACFSCHGAEGAGGIANPEGGDDVVPALSGGEMMMWADSEQQLREWILHGRTLEQNAEPRSGVTAGQGTGRALVMPAFEDFLGPGELDALVVYLQSISGLYFPEDPKTARGLELAHELGCFRCHGAMGTGGVPNPGSFKGYIPGFGGADYDELVPDGQALHEWIADGSSRAFLEDPLARRFLERQAVKMPAYGRHLSDADLEALAAVVSWLASGEWREQPVP